LTEPRYLFLKLRNKDCIAGDAGRRATYSSFEDCADNPVLALLVLFQAKNGFTPGENLCMVTPKKNRPKQLSQARSEHHVSILSALRGLDRLLALALSAMRETPTTEEAETADQFRGLYLTQDGIERLLAREPGAPAFSSGRNDEDLPDPSGSGGRLRWLADVYGLSAFDLNVVLIALAPELDLRYEQLYAYLQDNITRKRPTVDLALNLLCSDAPGKLARRTHFAPDAPLVRHGLLHLIPDANQQPSPLLAHDLKLDEQVIRFLTEQECLDSRLAQFCRLLKPTTRGVDATPDDVLEGAALELLGCARESGGRLGFYFQGPEGAGKRRAVEALACEAELSLLTVDLTRAVAVTSDYRWLFRLVLNEARFNAAILYCDGLDVLRREEHAVAYQSLLEALSEFAGLHVLSGTQALSTETNLALKIITVPFARPDFTQRRAIWLEHLSAEGIRLDDSEIDALAGRFRFSGRQIAGAVCDASLKARWRRAASPSRKRSEAQPTMHELFTSARAQSRHDLSTLASKIEPKYEWEDIQLPDDQLEQLREVCAQAERRHVVYNEWGFGRKMSMGRGVVVLFTGPPGTGKTMAAEVIATELQLDLFKIDLSQIVSKYIGETEKNLDLIFREAQSSNAILFFDEADALFGKRSEVKDAHDRFANIEIGYLLQKIEEFDGIAVLATNLRQNMDEAFVRRMRVIVEFPFPDEEYRRRIWKSVFPKEAPLGEDVEFAALARIIRLSGGHIKNIALAGAFYAASDGQVIRTPHLMRAARREYQKLGRKLNDADTKSGESGMETT
jgi:SpoVK/Ycf46/Vps4 family AAA+-type ATPase